MSNLDRELFLLINGGGTPLMDPLMIFLSYKWVWVPLYIGLIYKLILKNGKNSWIPIVVLIMVIVFTDQTTSTFMKPYFERLRPCHDPFLQNLVVIIDGCGGKYGFASGHAANTMGLAFFLWLYLDEKWLGYGMIFWSLMVGYSRIYLGVHFPGDVIIGFLVGIFFATLSYLAMMRGAGDRLLTSGGK